ncbi:hypothetical protein IV56_GL002102 [Lacticaseibacillus saniviri JCM 17471 = DSM 24301]|uniref:Uncharacterized protein n=1 Tax=Lacticaseibacillus saniviri JCM 17471 = DSM 24301 TaxID=1293598 RepID=A0A0R2MQM6_9LACO|nr:hypothetical protein IV56_GL002102 [Lacticaseibacillus saniviri JCM 17471 = DSM 24301]
MSATGVSLISQAIADGTKLQLLSVIGSTTKYTDDQLKQLTDTALTSASQNQTGWISNVEVKNDDTVYFEIVLDGTSVAADYTLNSVLILVKVNDQQHLFAVLKANQGQYMNAYDKDSKSSTNMQINTGFKISNSAVVSLEINQAALLTQNDLEEIKKYISSENITVIENAAENAKGLVADEAKLRVEANTNEATTRSQADQANSQAISQEAKDRVAADQALRKQVTEDIAPKLENIVYKDKPDQLAAGFKFADNLTINGAPKLAMNTGSGTGDNPVLQGYNAGTNLGDIVRLGGGGLTVIGAGESSSDIVAKILSGTMPSTFPAVSKDGESSVVAADEKLLLVSGWQDPNSAKVIDAAEIMQKSDLNKEYGKLSTTNNPNFDTMTITGNFTVSNTTVANNAPVDGQFGRLEVRDVYGSVVQTFMPDTASGQSWHRELYHGQTWSSWQKALEEADLDPYRNWYGTLAEYQALDAYDNNRDYYIIAKFEVMV